MAIILDGRKARDVYKSALVERVHAISDVPRMALLQVGNNTESNIYVNQKKKFAKDIGVVVDHVVFSEHASEEDIRCAIEEKNNDPLTCGIILQLPVPGNLDKDKLIDLIDPKKDIDGLTSENQRLLDEGVPRFVPATAKGVKLLLDFYGFDIAGKRVAVLGRSKLVGLPIAKLFSLSGAKVTVCHSKTPNTKEITRESDIVVAAIGKPAFVGASFLKENVVVVDVGTTSVFLEAKEGLVPSRKLVGDVDFEAVQSHVMAISPVPGGVGPMTVLSLFDNLILSAERRADER